MKMTTGTARRLLREANPVSEAAFADTARDEHGQATLASILDASAASSPAPARRPAIRLMVGVPAAAMSAALAALLAVMLSATEGPQQPGVASPPARTGFAGPPVDTGFAVLIADLTARSPAHPGDAAAVLRKLAAVAARQPAVPLGPVEYSQIKSWEFDQDNSLQYNLNYVSHTTRTSQWWQASDGSSLWYYTVPGGKYEPGTVPLQQSGPSQAGRTSFAWYDPARLPADVTALRAHLVHGPDTRGDVTSGGEVCIVSGTLPSAAAGSAGGSPTPALAQPSCHYVPPGPAGDRATNAIVYNAEDLMLRVPLPPGVRASLLRVLAGSGGT
jgi:hypothetical protein